MEQALFGITGLKACAADLKVRSEIPGLNPGTASETPSLEFDRVGGIPSVEVKFADIRRNTSGVGALLGRY